MGLFWVLRLVHGRRGVGRVAALGVDFLVELREARLGGTENARAPLFELLRGGRGSRRAARQGIRSALLDWLGRLVRRAVVQPVRAVELGALVSVDLGIQLAVEDLEFGGMLGNLVSASVVRTSLCASSCMSTRRVVL